MSHITSNPNSANIQASAHALSTAKSNNTSKDVGIIQYLLQMMGRDSAHDTAVESVISASNSAAAKPKARSAAEDDDSMQVNDACTIC